jgi:hypothetical protein
VTLGRRSCHFVSGSGCELSVSGFAATSAYAEANERGGGRRHAAWRGALAAAKPSTPRCTASSTRSGLAWALYSCRSGTTRRISVPLMDVTTYLAADRFVGNTVLFCELAQALLLGPRRDFGSLSRRKTVATCVLNAGYRRQRHQERKVARKSGRVRGAVRSLRCIELAY